MAAVVGVGVVLFLISLAVSSARRGDARRDAEEAERQRLAQLSVHRVQWGPVVGTHEGDCPSCGKVCVLKVYQTGNVEAHCGRCGHRQEM